MSKAAEIADRVAQLAAAGRSQRQIAAELGVSKTTVVSAAKIAGVGFDKTKTEAATAAAQVTAAALREPYVRNLYKLGNRAQTQLFELAGKGQLKPRELLTLLGIASDKIVRFEQAVDTKEESMEQSKQALEDLMTAIENSVDDDVDWSEVARSAIPPGAPNPDCALPPERRHPDLY